MNSFTFDIEKIDDAARWVIDQSKKQNVWLFDGPMGAGKTTLIARICKILGVKGDVQSPTFSIVNEYITEDKKIVYHFDCYRLKNTIEALDIGIEEYLDSGHYCFVEWPEKIEELLPQKVARIMIEMLNDGTRKLEKM